MMYISFKQNNIIMSKRNLDRFLKQKRIERISRLIKELCETDSKQPQKIKFSPNEQKTLKNSRFSDFEDD